MCVLPQSSHRQWVKSLDLNIGLKILWSADFLFTKSILVSIIEGVTLKTFAEAMWCPRWRDTMRLEIEAQERNKTWLLWELPSSKCFIVCKWIYTIKHNEYATVKMYKVKLVACGVRKNEGIDYSETFFQW